MPLSQRNAYAGILPAAATASFGHPCAWWRDRLAAPGIHHLLVAEDVNTGLVGFGLLTTDLQPWATVSALHVRPDLHSHGVGTGLVDGLPEVARERGRSHAQLFVLAENDPARSFYAHLGFVLASEGPRHTIAGYRVDTVRYTRPLV